MIGKLLRWFYCLDLSSAVLVLAAGTLLFFLLRRYLGHRRWWKWFVWAALLAILGAILYSTVGNRSGGSEQPHMWIPFHSYREAVLTGNREIYRSNFMNAALFYPAGLLAAACLPEKVPRWGRCALILLLFAVFSGGIEYAQYRYALGRCEVDDVIHNAAGALLGGLVSVLTPLLFQFLHSFSETGQTGP